MVGMQGRIGGWLAGLDDWDGWLGWTVRKDGRMNDRFPNLTSVLRALLLHNLRLIRRLCDTIRLRFLRGGVILFRLLTFLTSCWLVWLFLLARILILFTPIIRLHGEIDFTQL